MHTIYIKSYFSLCSISSFGQAFLYLQEILTREGKYHFVLIEDTKKWKYNFVWCALNCLLCWPFDFFRNHGILQSLTRVTDHNEYTCIQIIMLECQKARKHTRLNTLYISDRHMYNNVLKGVTHLHITTRIQD